MAVQPMTPDMLSSLTGDHAASGADLGERQRQLIALRLASPKRAGAGQPIEQQQDAAHLPLFVAANEPSLF